MNTHIANKIIQQLQPFDLTSLYREGDQDVSFWSSNGFIKIEFDSDKSKTYSVTFSNPKYGADATVSGVQVDQLVGAVGYYKCVLQD